MDELFSVSYMLFFKDVFIGFLPTLSLKKKKQPSEQVKQNTRQELNVSSCFPAAVFHRQLKGPYFAQLPSPIYSNANHRRFCPCLKDTIRD